MCESAPMPPLTRQQLRARRTQRRKQERARRHRILRSTLIPMAVAGVVTAALWIALSDRPPGGADTPTTPVPAGPGGRPTPIPIARAALTQLRLPVERGRVTTIMFRPSGDPQAVALAPLGPMPNKTADRRGRTGPDRAAVDIGAPAGTRVYSPVDGTVIGVSDWVLRGTVVGIQVSIEPQSASDLAVVVTHIRPSESSPPVRVGTAVRAGITVLGQIVDLSGIIEQELARYSADSGNHVALEVIRTEQT